MTRGFFGRLAILAALIVLPAAYADPITESVLYVEVQTEQDSATFEVTQAMVTASPIGNSWAYVLNADQPIFAGDNLLATLKGGTTLTVVTPEGSGLRESDIQTVQLDFAMQAGASTTTFRAYSALLRFASITNPVARAQASFLLTDGNGNSAATLSPASGYAGAFVSQYGVGTASSTFTQLVNTFSATAEPTSIGAQSPADYSWMTLGGPADCMRSRIGFTITPGDLASGTSVFQIAPEPASLLLAASGLVLFWRRR